MPESSALKAGEPADAMQHDRVNADVSTLMAGLSQSAYTASTPHNCCPECCLASLRITHGRTVQVAQTNIPFSHMSHQHLFDIGCDSSAGPPANKVAGFG